MCVLFVLRSLIFVCSVSVLLETCNFVAEAKFTVNSANPATFSDVMLRVEAFYKDGRRFDQNKIYVWVNVSPENCWYLNNRGNWKRKMKCILKDVPETKQIELYNKQLHNDSIIPYRGYHNGYL